jgi:hypothetical protein
MKIKAAHALPCIVKNGKTPLHICVELWFGSLHWLILAQMVSGFRRYIPSMIIETTSH